MGKVKYQKRTHSTVAPKNKKDFTLAPALSSSEKNAEIKTLLNPRHFQRRPAITPNDLSSEVKFAMIYRKFLPNKSLDKGQDGLHLAKQSKRAKRRRLAKAKMAGAFGNMDSLVDALPAVEKVVKNSSRSVKEKPRLNKSLKSQETEMIKDIQWYRSAIHDPAFQADPFAAVAANIHQRLRSEQRELS